MASPVLPAWLQMLTWGTLAIVCAMHLSAFDPLPRQTGGWPRLFKGIGVLLVVLGALQIIGLASGGRDPLQPLRHLAGAAARGESSRTVSSTDQAGARFVRIGSGDDLQRSIAASSRPVLLDVYADWCTACKEMELQTFRDPRVVSVLERFTLLQVDVTANNASDRAFMKRFGLFGPPGTLVLDRDGNEHPAGRTVGFAPADVFLARIDKVATAR